MKNKIKVIKDIVLRNFKNLFEYEKEEENYYKSVRVNSTWSNNYFEFQSNSDINKNTISWKIRIRWCIQKVITWKAWLTMKQINFWKKLFYSLKDRYQKNLGSMRENDFVLDYVQLLYYKCHKVYLNCDGSYIDSPDWMKTKKQQ